MIKVTELYPGGTIFRFEAAGAKATFNFDPPTVFDKQEDSYAIIAAHANVEVDAVEEYLKQCDLSEMGFFEQIAREQGYLGGTNA